MIPILYENNETNFTSNGLGRLPDCISAKVTEERNGVFELTFEYPVNGANYDNIQLGRIVAVVHESTNDIQPFDIVSCSRPIEGVVTFFATHISYRLKNYIVWKKDIGSLDTALKMFEASTPPNPFVFSSDFSSSGYMAAADGTPRTIRELLGGVEGSILDTYGGEFRFDKFNVHLMRNRGTDANLTIRYGLNLTKYDENIDISGSYSCAVPFWNSDKLVRGNLVRSGGSTMFGRDVAIPLDLTDKFETAPTAAQLETYALNYLNANETFLPTQSIEIDFVDLARSSEYTELAPLLDARLCDTVKVVFPRYNMSGKFKVVKTEYNVLAERFLTITLGTLATNLSEALGISNSLGNQSGGGGMLYQDFVISKHTPAAHSVPASSYEGWSIGAFTKEGYYPLGIVGFDMSGTGTGQCVPIKYYLTDRAIGTTQAYVGVRNNRTSATSTTFSIDVLWVKAGS